MKGKIIQIAVDGADPPFMYVLTDEGQIYERRCGLQSPTDKKPWPWENVTNAEVVESEADND